MCSSSLAYKQIKFNKGVELEIVWCLVCFLKHCWRWHLLHLVNSLQKKKSFLYCQKWRIFSYSLYLGIGGPVSYWIVTVYILRPLALGQTSIKQFLFSIWELVHGPHNKESITAILFMPSFANGSTLYPPLEIRSSVFNSTFFSLLVSKVVKSPAAHCLH